MNSQIRDIAGCLPDFVLTNEALDRENPEWNVALATQRIGVTSRHIAAQDETALDLAVRASKILLSRNPALHDTLDMILFCTQSADYILPPNSCLLHGRLELAERVAALDISHACSGYVYALGMADSMIRSGMAGNVLLVTADTYSKFINPGDRSARIMFGDGAAATWVSASEEQSGVRDVLLGTAGTQFDKFIIPAGGCRTPRSAETSREQVDKSGNRRSLEEIHMSGQDILNFVMSKIPAHVKEILKRNDLTVEDADLFVFHQASSIVLEVLTRLLRLEDSKVFSNLAEIGNTVSSSIPLALRGALDAGRAKPGDTVLLCGFGVGLSWGSVLVEL